MNSRDSVLHPRAHLEIFGFQPTPADAAIIARETSWRVSRALGYLALCWGIMPLVFFIPPHVPWVLGAFCAGIFFCRKFLLEKRTLMSLSGTCPKCGHALSITKPVRLKVPHVLTCTTCQHQSLLYVDPL